MTQRDFIDGRFQVPLPEDGIERARVFGEVSIAWATMLHSIRQWLAGQPAMPTLNGAPMPGSWRPPPPAAVVPTPTKQPEPNGKRRGRPAKAKANKGGKRGARK